jgi:hypothetical protein
MRRSAGGVASISAFEFKVVGCNHTQAHKHTYKRIGVRSHQLTLRESLATVGYVCLCMLMAVCVSDV